MLAIGTRRPMGGIPRASQAGISAEPIFAPSTSDTPARSGIAPICTSVTQSRITATDENMMKASASPTSAAVT